MGSISINGKRINVPNGANVSIRNNVVYINGERWEDSENGQFKETVHLNVEGNLINLSTDGSATVNGNITGNLSTGGSGTISGSVGGNVAAGGSIRCGTVHGSAMAGGSITGVR